MDILLYIYFLLDNYRLSTKQVKQLIDKLQFFFLNVLFVLSCLGVILVVVFLTFK